MLKHIKSQKTLFYLSVITKTLNFVLREMTSDEGGFYSSIDADSEGEEGKYYVWSKNEIQEILGNDADVFCLFYDVTDGGNFEGKTILCNNMLNGILLPHNSIPSMAFLLMFVFYNRHVSVISNF